MEFGPVAMAARRRPGFKHEFKDLLRAAAGGFLFGIPLLYTMEVSEITVKLADGWRA